MVVMVATVVLVPAQLLREYLAAISKQHLTNLYKTDFFSLTCIRKRVPSHLRKISTLLASDRSPWLHHGYNFGVLMATASGLLRVRKAGVRAHIIIMSVAYVMMLIGFGMGVYLAYNLDLVSLPRSGDLALLIIIAHRAPLHHRHDCRSNAVTATTIWIFGTSSVQAHRSQHIWSPPSLGRPRLDHTCGHQRRFRTAAAPQIVEVDSIVLPCRQPVCIWLVDSVYHRLGEIQAPLPQRSPDQP